MGFDNFINQPPELEPRSERILEILEDALYEEIETRKPKLTHANMMRYIACLRVSSLS